MQGEWSFIVFFKFSDVAKLLRKSFMFSPASVWASCVTEPTAPAFKEGKREGGREGG
jgi:hypothetical protein